MKLEELMADEMEALQDDCRQGQDYGARSMPAAPPREVEFRRDEFAERWDYRAQRRDARNRRAMSR